MIDLEKLPQSVLIEWATPQLDGILPRAIDLVVIDQTTIDQYPAGSMQITPAGTLRAHLFFIVDLPDPRPWDRRERLLGSIKLTGSALYSLQEVALKYETRRVSLLSLLRARAAQLKAHPIAIQAWGDEGEEVLF